MRSSASLGKSEATFNFSRLRNIFFSLSHQDIKIRTSFSPLYTTGKGLRAAQNPGSLRGESLRSQPATFTIGCVFPSFPSSALPSHPIFHFLISSSSIISPFFPYLILNYPISQLCNSSSCSESPLKSGSPLVTRENGIASIDNSKVSLRRFFRPCTATFTVINQSLRD